MGYAAFEINCYYATWFVCLYFECEIYGHVLDFSMAVSKLCLLCNFLILNYKFVNLDVWKPTFYTMY